MHKVSKGTCAIPMEIVGWTTFATMQDPALQYIFGRHPVMEAVKSGRLIDSIFIDNELHGDFEIQIRRLSSQQSIPLKRVPVSALNRMIRGNHQGIIAACAAIRTFTSNECIDTWISSPEPVILVMCDGITDVRNLGSIARSCCVAGASALILSEKHSPVLSAEAVKASAGALNHVTICRDHSLMHTAALLKNHGIMLCAADLRGGVTLADCPLTGPVCILLGAEDKGINRMLLAEADTRFRIPQGGDFDSFNVAVSAGIILYETLRQRALEKR